IYLNRKAQLLDRAPVAFITSALACACGGFRYDDVIKYLKTGLCGVSRRELDRLENYLFTWDVRGNMWTREDGFSQGDEKTTAGEHIDSPLQAINRTRARIRTPLCELKSALAGQTTGREFATALFEFMEHVGLARRLAARARLSRMRGELQLEDEYRRLWDILIDAVGTIAHVLPDTVLKSDKFGELFTLLISQYEIGVIPVSLDRISVGDLDRTENTTPRAVIILGACDGNLPMSSDGTGIFTDAEKERLCELGVSLPGTADARMFDEFRIIYGAFTKASERLIIISPRTGSDMSERRESFIIPRIRAIFPKLEYSEYAAPQTQAQAPCFDFALSRGDDPWQYAAREYFKDDARLEQAMRNASLKRSPVHDIDNIRAIFGDTIRLSASRTDTFSSCRYHYFLQYGLRLKPRRVKGLDAPQIGTFIHFVLEHTLRGVKLRGGHHAVCADDVTRLADEAIEEFANTQLGGFRDRSARFIYLFKRLKKTVHAVVLDVHEELSQSKFAPLDFELHFSDHDGDLPAMHLRGDGYELKLEGFVDRVDGYKIDDVLYLRVVDYKTGKREFSLNEVINGLNMQLLLYLFTLCECGQERYGAELLPGGALYVPARDPIVFASNNEEGGLARASELRRRGIILQDTRLLDDSAAFLPIKIMKNGEFDKRSFVASLDGFNIIKTRIKNILGEIGKELSHGEIEANPYYKSLSETACDYCEYKSACHFDEACGDRRRYLFEKKMEGC
ncbi:MAG: PD-(D/E)XK nuclease family protein, partial [Clostridia bacterium]